VWFGFCCVNDPTYLTRNPIPLSPGFQHTAFCLRAESKLEAGPNYSKHVRRGELVELLSKALLYTEVEAHWQKDAVTTACQTPFTLLDEHKCSSDATQTNVPITSTLAQLASGAAPSSVPVPAMTDDGKRKAPDQLAPEVGAEKRQRTSSPMTLESSATKAGAPASAF
jgi:transducin (beta)-like 1